MSRHGYTDDQEQQDYAMWRGRILSAIRGKRGQAMLRDLAAALDAMPDKRLVARVLQTKDGDACALGCLARVRGKDLSEHSEEDIEDDPDWFNALLSEEFNVAECLIREVEWENDEGGWRETPEQRWTRMRKWCDRHIKATP